MQVWQFRTNTPVLFQELSHLAKAPSLCYIITRKGNQNIPLSSIPGSNIGAIKHGERTAGPKYEEDDSHFAHPTFGNIVIRFNAVS